MVYREFSPSHYTTDTTAGQLSVSAKVLPDKAFEAGKSLTGVKMTLFNADCRLATADCGLSIAD
jgi:hypothetical protein